MKEKKHIEKELLFKNNIKDITSISLDSDYKVENKEILGNFLITGEYKIHEVSINKEKFNFKIPFNHKIEDDIDSKTVKIEINNFEYDYSKDELMVNIEYEIIGDREDVFIFDDKESLEDFLNNREVEVVDTRIEEIKEEIDKIEETKKEENSVKEATKELTQRIVEETLDRVENINNISEPQIQEKEIDKIETDKIINNVEKIEDGYVTYKVYTIKENETLENIVIKYHTTIDELKEYNDLNNLSVNDKIIIPTYE